MIKIDEFTLQLFVYEYKKKLISNSFKNIVSTELCRRQCILVRVCLKLQRRQNLNACEMIFQNFCHCWMSRIIKQKRVIFDFRYHLSTRC